jgi:hypothetical protein
MTLRFVAPRSRAHFSYVFMSRLPFVLTRFFFMRDPPIVSLLLQYGGPR